MTGQANAFLDNPPDFHSKLLDYGCRPYWSPDGKRIAFVDKAFGDVSEMDFKTREVRQLAHNLGDHHSFLRVLFLRPSNARPPKCSSWIGSGPGFPRTQSAFHTA